MKPTGHIKHANLATSKRLQRLHALLLTGKEYTTRQIGLMANIEAVSVAVCELRKNSVPVTCRLISAKGDSRVYVYRLESP